MCGVVCVEGACVWAFACMCMCTYVRIMYTNIIYIHTSMYTCMHVCCSEDHMMPLSHASFLTD